MDTMYLSALRKRVSVARRMEATLHQRKKVSRKSLVCMCVCILVIVTPPIVVGMESMVHLHVHVHAEYYYWYYIYTCII